MVDDFPATWRILSLEDCMEAIIDYRGKTPRKTSTGIPLITAKVVKNGRIEEPDEFIDPDGYPDWMRRGLPQQGDVLVTTEAPLGEVAQLDGRKVALAQRLITLRAKTSLVNSTFLKFLMQSAFVQEQLKARATGTTVLGIKQSELRKVLLVVPPLNEQHAIAAILGMLGDKIELNRRMNRTLEAMAQAIFKSWFVDYAPVRAKAEGFDLGLPKHIADLFPDEFEESEVGEMPRGWSTGQLGDCVGLLGGYAFKSKDWIEQGVPIVKIGSVKPGIVDLDEVSFVSEKIAAEAKKYRLDSGDLLIGMTGYVGEVGLVPPNDKPPLLNQRVGKFVLESSGTAALAFVYCLTCRPEFKMVVEMKAHGTAQANVSVEGILSVPSVVPPKQIRDKFNQVGQPMLDRILSHHAESRALTAIRDTLLPQLISGEIQVKDAEAIVGRAI